MAGRIRVGVLRGRNLHVGKCVVELIKCRSFFHLMLQASLTNLSEGVGDGFDVR